MYQWPRVFEDSPITSRNGLVPRCRCSGVWLRGPVPVYANDHALVQVSSLAQKGGGSCGLDTGRGVTGSGSVSGGGSPVVDVPAGGGPGGAAVGVVGDRPAWRLFDLVVAPALDAEVGRASQPGAVIWIMRDAVVDIAAMRRHPAARELAGLVPGNDQTCEGGRRAVAGGAVVQRPTRCRVGKDAPPGAAGGEVTGDGGGDRAIAGQLPGQVIRAQQRGIGNCDPYVHATTTTALPTLAPAAGVLAGGVFQVGAGCGGVVAGGCGGGTGKPGRVEHQVDQGVGAALAGGA